MKKSAGHSKSTLFPALCSFVLALVLSLPVLVHAKVIEQIIAIIDGEPYTLSNLETYAKARMNRSFPTGELAKINASDREVLEQFLTEKLVESEIREAGIKVADEDVDQYIQQVKKSNRLTDEELKTALSREGQTLESYRSSVRSELEKNELINRQVRKKVNITNEDVERYYKVNAKNYRAPDRARIRHILFALPETASAEQTRSASEKAEAVYKRIQAGEDFATLAAEFSEGAGKNDGGDIGWVNRGTLISGLEDVAFQKLSVGAVSEPFRTTMGIHIVKLEAREIGTTLPLTSVSGKIKDELYAKAMEERFDKWLKTDLRRKHKVDVKIAGVVFKPEDTKEDTLGSLMASSNRAPRREQQRSFLSYLNPFSYVIKETPLEEDDPKSPLYGKKVVTVFGQPLFTSEGDGDDVPDVLSPQTNKSDSGSKSGGFLDSINPFKK
ncbi:MAG TPA: peptidylprolyl isomerase [Candidatus Binatia bacterium]